MLNIAWFVLKIKNILDCKRLKCETVHQEGLKSVASNIISVNWNNLIYNKNAFIKICRNRKNINHKAINFLKSETKLNIYLYMHQEKFPKKAKKKDK